jgi:hypothetical protein
MTSGSCQKIAVMKKEEIKRKDTRMRSGKETLEIIYARIRPRINKGKIKVISVLANVHCHLVRLLSSNVRKIKSVAKVQSDRREIRRT